MLRGITAAKRVAAITAGVLIAVLTGSTVAVLLGCIVALLLIKERKDTEAA